RLERAVAGGVGGADVVELADRRQRDVALLRRDGLALCLHSANARHLGYLFAHGRCSERLVQLDDFAGARTSANRDPRIDAVLVAVDLRAGDHRRGDAEVCGGGDVVAGGGRAREDVWVASQIEDDRTQSVFVVAIRTQAILARRAVVVEGRDRDAAEAVPHDVVARDGVARDAGREDDAGLVAADGRAVDDVAAHRTAAVGLADDDAGAAILVEDRRVNLRSVREQREAAAARRLAAARHVEMIALEASVRTDGDADVRLSGD